jgi:hypothetical protein
VPLRDGRRFALVNPGGITDPTGTYATDSDAPTVDQPAGDTCHLTTSSSGPAVGAAS